MNAVDTNILLYIRDHNEPKKQDIAIDLVRSLTDGALLWQVAGEYIHASRKLKSTGYTPTKAWEDMKRFQFFWTTILPDWEIFNLAEDLHLQKQFSFWDSMIVAACLHSNVKNLYSEDFHEQKIENLTIINPFK
jgi:predicted nucleic acid-binding protein